MSLVLVLQHVSHETLGTLEQHLAGAGLECEYVDLFRGIPASLEWERAAGLVVLGGPMNVDEVRKYAFLKHEVTWLREAIELQVPVLGICLGAQLLAKAMGARVYPNAVKEIGWYEIELTAEAAGDPLFAGCDPRPTVFQWHGDTFDLPPGAVPLARGELCRHQAFRYGRSAWGLQFHVEMTEALVSDWLVDAENDAEVATLDYIDPASIRALLPERLPRVQALGDAVLPRFAALCAQRRRG